MMKKEETDEGKQRKAVKKEEWEESSEVEAECEGERLKTWNKTRLAISEGGRGEGRREGGRLRLLMSDTRIVGSIVVVATFSMRSSHPVITDEGKRGGNDGSIIYIFLSRNSDR